jgi:hypothetical protein
MKIRIAKKKFFPSILHEKGTFNEVIFGVIYVELWVDHVVRVLPQVQYP